MFSQQHQQNLYSNAMLCSNAANYSQDFGDAQSASQQDSSGEAFGMHGTFNRGAAGGSQSMITDNSSKQSPSTLIINKKSDWTMDMPKIEY